MGIRNLLQRNHPSPAPVERDPAPATPRANGTAATAANLSLAGALFTTTQQRLYALLFGQPDRSFYATELIKLAGIGSGAIQRELKKLEETGLVTISRVGTQKHYQANPASPVYDELCGLVRKTVDMYTPLRKALDNHQQAIELAMVYGVSTSDAPLPASEMGLLVIGDHVAEPTLRSSLKPAEAALGRSIKLKLLSGKEFHRRLREKNAFLKLLMAGETNILIGAFPQV